MKQTRAFTSLRFEARNLTAVCCLALALSACRSKAPPEGTQPTPSASTSVARSAPTPPPMPREPPNAPTEEDFEEEAESITAKNLEDELDKLEKELSPP